MVNIETLTMAEFKSLPLVIEGESKEVRYAGHGMVVIRFKPTIYSFTHNRCGEVPGSEILRLRASKLFLEVLRQAGVNHAYREVNDRWVLAELVMPHEVEFTKYSLPVFIPEDLTQGQIAALHHAPPVEIIVKTFHGGTSEHRYLHMHGSMVRSSHPLYAGEIIRNKDAYPHSFVRFDWRNPLKNNNGDRIADEILPDEMADWFIDVNRARQTARDTYRVLEQFLAEHQIVCNDLCLFITEDGSTLYGEISQDCGRFRHFDLGSLDKDVWRAGGSAEDVLKKW